MESKTRWQAEKPASDRVSDRGRWGTPVVWRFVRMQNVLNMREDDTKELRPEYDFSPGVRGKHYESYRRGANVVRVTSGPSEALDDSAIPNEDLSAVTSVTWDRPDDGPER